MPVSISKLRKLLSHVICYLSIVFFLSGCTAIGSNKPAALQVTSTPEASVFLDGKHLGKTPFFSDQLKSGEYTIKIAAPDANYTDKIKLQEGTLTVVNRELANNFLAQSGESLWLEHGKKGVFVVSQPADADVTIDGKLEGQTPILIQDVPEGDHKVVLTEANSIDREFVIKTSRSYRLVADVTLASEIAKGTPKSEPTVPQIKKVEITKTAQGFLRVRKEPSLTSPEVGRVNAGEQVEVIQETDGWIKIIFTDPSSDKATKQGWVSTQYTKKL